MSMHRCALGLGSTAAVNIELLPQATELCCGSPLGQRTVKGSLDTESSGNGKKQQTALEGNAHPQVERMSYVVKSPQITLSLRPVHYSVQL